MKLGSGSEANTQIHHNDANLSIWYRSASICLMRAVIEALADDGPQTVPDIAARKCVSQQHIQVNVDALINKNLILTRANPAHRRAPLIVLSVKGRNNISDMRIDEAVLLVHLVQNLSSADPDQTGNP